VDYICFLEQYFKEKPPEQAVFYFADYFISQSTANFNITIATININAIRINEPIPCFFSGVFSVDKFSMTI
jgi:hypothetical protein